MIKNEITPGPVKVGSAVSLVLAAVAAVLYGIAYHTSYDDVSRHFESGCITAKLAFLLMAASAVVAAVCGFLLRRKYIHESGPAGQLEMFMTWLAAFMFLGFAAVCAINGEIVVPASDSVKLDFGRICIMAIPVLSIFSSVPFICASSRRLCGGILHGITSVIPVFWAASVMFKYYFDLHEVPLNDPELALTIASMSALILFLLTECRLALGISFPAGNVFTSCLCVGITGLVSVARIVLSFISEQGLLIPTLMECIMMATLAALAFSRLVASLEGVKMRVKETDEKADVSVADATKNAENRN